MVIVGDMEKTNSLAIRDIPASINLERIKTTRPARNRSIAKALAKSRNQTLTQKRWGLSFGEFHNGWLSEPAPVTNLDLQTAALSPRFCIAEQNGFREPKYRLIDDLAKSLVNGAFGSSETYCPHGIDSFVALSRLQASYGANQLRARPVDFSHAYKTIALHPGSADASYSLFANPNHDRPYKSRIPVHPFGSRRAPANWGRVVAFIQFVALKLICHAVGAFAYDVYCAEDRAVASSGSGPSNSYAA